MKTNKTNIADPIMKRVKQRNLFKQFIYLYFWIVYKLCLFILKAPLKILIAFTKPDKYLIIGSLTAAVMLLFNLGLIYSVNKIEAGKSTSTEFYQGLLDGNLYHNADNFNVMISNQDDKPSTTVTSGKSKLTATLINTHIKTEGSNANIFNKFIPVANASYKMSDQVSLDYQLLKGTAPTGQIVGETMTGLKEDIVLYNKESPRIFQFKLDMENIARYMNIDGNWYFYDENNKVIFYIPAAFMVDNNGEISYSVVQEIIKNSDNETILYIAADSVWLDDAKRAWPVKIDPSVVVSGSIATDNTETRFGGIQRKIVYSYTSGNWYAFYNESGDVWYKKSADGSTWGSAVDVAAGDADNYNPSVWLDANRYIYVAWIDDSGDSIEFDRIDTGASDSQLTTECFNLIPGDFTATTFTVSIAVDDNDNVYTAISDTSSDTEAGIYKTTSIASCTAGTNWTGINFTTLSATTIYLTTADTSPWTVPDDWTDNGSVIRAIGGGGAGDNTSSTAGQGGGGGGAYAEKTGLDLTPGDNIVFGVGTGGTDGVNGGTTWFNAASAGACTDSNVCVKAAGGTTATSSSGGAGGSVAGSIGVKRVAGGNGGSGNTVGNDSTGGGGGAGSPNNGVGQGGDGGNGDSVNSGEEANGGGGGAGCDSITDLANYGVQGGDNGGDGGASCFASGGAGGTLGGNGNAGTNGSGGGGGDEIGDGGNGGDGIAASDISMAGGGGGGGDDDTGGVGGNGGLYGGGGGGGATVGNGAPGIISITYTPTVTPVGSGDRPVLITVGNTLHLFTQDGNLSHSVYDGSSWTTVNNTIASVTDSTYDVTTDGTNIWLLTDAAADSTNTNFYKYNGASWSTETAPFTSQTAVDAVSITYNSTDKSLTAHIIKDSSQQAYYSISNAHQINWSNIKSYGFTAGDIDTLSSPMTVTANSQVGVVVRQGSNFEFAGISPPTDVRLNLKFDEFIGTGNTTPEDSSLYNNDGSSDSTVLQQTEDFCISGKCMYFAGDGKITVGSSINTTLNFSALDSFTVEAWIKIPSTANTTGYIINRTSAVTSRGYRLIHSNGDMCFQIGDSNLQVPQACTTGINFLDDQWHHIVGVRDVTNDTLYLYVDGILRASTSDNTTATIKIDANFYIGAAENGTAAWTGWMDEIKVIHGARSAEQVKTDYNARGTILGTSANLGNNKDNPNSLTNGLAGYWKMNESDWNNDCTATSVTDSSGMGNNGKSCPSTTGPDPSGTAKFDRAGNFDGSNDYVDIAADTSLNNSSFSVGGWVRPTTLRVQGIITKNNYANSWRLFMRNANGGLEFDAKSDTINLTSNSNIAVNTWTHVMVTFDASTLSMKLYINGVLDKEQTASGDMGGTNNSDLVFGVTDSTPANPFVGQIDEIRYYNRALSSIEIVKLYNFAPSPIGYWPMNEKTSTIIYDSSGNANTSSTFSGNTSWTTGKYGSGLNFDGTDDVVRIPETTSTDLGNVVDESLTVGAWFKTTTNFSADATIVAKHSGAGSTLPFYVSLNSNEFACFLISDGTNLPSVCGSTALNDGKWHYVTAVRDRPSDLLRLYIDGVLVNTADDTTNGAAIGNNNDVSIGNSNGGSYVGDDFNGQIDEVKIYNYARTPAQIIEDMNAGHPAPGSPVSSPLGWWKMDQGVDNTCSGGTNDVCNSGYLGSTADGASTGFSSPATSTSGWTNSGKFGKALIFDGTSDDVVIGGESNFDFEYDDPFTLSIWVKTNTETLSALEPMIGKTDLDNPTASALRGYLLSIRGDIANDPYELLITSDTNTNKYISVTVPRTADTNWHHVVATYDGSGLAAGIQIYVDGKAGTKTVVLDALASNTILHNRSVDIGGTDGGTGLFNGTLDEAKIYNSALTSEQVKLDMNQGSSQILGAGGNNSSYQSNAANQEYCVPGDSTSCAVPIAEWTFDEKTSTTTYDRTGNTNNGTLNSTTWAPGKIGSSTSYNGSNSYISIANESNFDFERTDDFTITGWIKPNKTRSGGEDSDYIISKLQSTSPYPGWGLRLTWNPANNPNETVLVFVLGNDFDATGGFNGIVSEASTDLQNNTWYHVAIVYDGQSNGSTIKIYVNGKLETITAALNNLSASTLNNTAVDIGRSPQIGGIDYFNGNIDNMRVYDYQRTPTQIAWEYNRGGPSGWWKFDECTGDTTYDASVTNSNNGTRSGTSGGNTSSGVCTVADSATARYNGVTGKLNYALDFDGTDDVVTVTNADAIDFDIGLKQGMSYTAWIYAHDDGEGGTSTGGEIIDKGTNTYMRVDNRSGDNLDFEAQIDLGTTDANVNISNAFTVNTWNHVAITYDDDSDDDMLVYINGKLRGTGDGSGAPATSDSNNLLIGGSSSNNFDGLIDDVRVYNYGLTETQIKTIMNEGAVRYGPTTGVPN